MLRVWRNLRRTSLSSLAFNTKSNIVQSSPLSLHSSPSSLSFFSSSSTHLSSSTINSPLNMDTVHTTERLAQLRSLMKEHKLDVYGMQSRTRLEASFLSDHVAVVPSEDSHQSEYIAPCDARRGLRPKYTLFSTLLISCSIHIWFLWLSWHCCHYYDKGILGDGRKIFQPSQ